jgi:predicted glycogen debranching enzyme
MMPDTGTMAASLRLDGWHRGEPLEDLLWREWIVTNGLGGYASGTIAGVATRRYHGPLIAALPSPLGRVVMLNHLEQFLELPHGRYLRLAGDERRGREVQLPDPNLLEQFHLDFGLPRWRYVAEPDVVLEKAIVMPYQQNTTCMIFDLVSAPHPVRLRLQPSINFRPHEEIVSVPPPERWTLENPGAGRWEICGAPEYPPLRLLLAGRDPHLEDDGSPREHAIYRLERDRGYESEGPLWSPGAFEVTLDPGESAALIISTEPWETVLALSPPAVLEAERKRRLSLLTRAGVEPEAQLAAHLVLAADQFIITPHSRVADVARLHAAGDEPRTVIAGYHWFTDWGRDTMISLEGLTLATGRQREAGSILRTFAHYVRDGLIPNMFPEGENDGLYHTADATLWYFHAVERYVQWTGDRATLRLLLPTLRDIVEHHIRGTRFGIGVDPRDGLLRQGAEGYQLTWMDAKVDGWVVTPRRGKAVEINALFYNAVQLLAGWLAAEGDEAGARDLAARADAVREAFNRRFWIDRDGYLYDVIDGEEGDDPAFRPNQIFAISLDHPVLDRSRWEAVVTAVAERLLTPVGLRSLSRDHPEYKQRYDGDLRARDAAYHQGTVWGWLIGPFIDAWLKTFPDQPERAHEALSGVVPHLRDAGIGTISEVFDAEEPFTPRGCMAQAWSVAEVLRCLRRLGAISR